MSPPPLPSQLMAGVWDKCSRAGWVLVACKRNLYDHDGGELVGAILGKSTYISLYDPDFPPVEYIGDDDAEMEALHAFIKMADVMHWNVWVPDDEDDEDVPGLSGGTGTFLEALEAAGLPAGSPREAVEPARAFWNEDGAADPERIYSISSGLYPREG